MHGEDTHTPRVRRAVYTSEESTRSIPYIGLVTFQTNIAPGHKTLVVLISWDLRLGPQSQPASKQHTQHRTWGPQAPKSNVQRSTHTANQSRLQPIVPSESKWRASSGRETQHLFCEQSHPTIIYPCPSERANKDICCALMALQ